jgi:hypothetical protein
VGLNPIIMHLSAQNRKRAKRKEGRFPVTARSLAHLVSRVPKTSLFVESVYAKTTRKIILYSLLASALDR